jgi:hypothetical protein
MESPLPTRGTDRQSLQALHPTAGARRTGERNTARRVECITISSRIAARGIQSFMNEAPLQVLGRADTPAPASEVAGGKSEQKFVMDALVSGDGESRRIAAFGCDIYAISTPLVGEA